jgi:hypothetical protein
LGEVCFLVDAKKETHNIIRYQYVEKEGRGLLGERPEQWSETNLLGKWDQPTRGIGTNLLKNELTFNTRGKRLT